MGAIDPRELLESASRTPAELLEDNPEAIGALFTALLVTRAGIDVTTDAAGGIITGP